LFQDGHSVPVKGRDLPVDEQFFNGFCAAGKADTVPGLPGADKNGRARPGTEKRQSQLRDGDLTGTGEDHRRKGGGGGSIQGYPVVFPAQGPAAGKMKG